MAAGTTPRHDGGAAGEGQEYGAGTPAPVTGIYESVNLFGRRTGHRTTVQQGEVLPPLPRGFTWALVERHAPPES